MTNFEQLKEYGQEHLLRYWDELSDAEKQSLKEQINEADFTILKELANKDEKVMDENSAGALAPLGALEIDEIDKKKAEFEAVGIKALQEGKVCALLLGGGQGTRLGHTGPKGSYNIGVTRDFYIFEAQINNMLDVCKKAGCYFPLVIMTSDKNDEETRRFLKEHAYFGYPEEKIRFFRQEMAPSCDYNGKIYMEGKAQLSLSPNGNGGWFKSLVKSGIDKELKEAGVEWINVFSMDNVLQRICDPVFIGATILSGTNCGAKVVSKNAPGEKVGALCLKDGLPTIVEYYELGDDLANELDENGKLKYRFGVILNYLFSMKRMYEIVDGKMPLHIVEKKIPYMNEAGEMVKPEKENGYKFEYLAIDTVRDMLTCLSYEVDREKEFAPIKNKEGVDSVVSARALLAKNGVIC
ncbi:MAG: UTP--glucose-1-phosphate uridylyltransferase [Clostridia bacterium]|nr:UTP--glucose-1-phosphate uridylyltransferase [Clostridia bacterium]